MFNDIRRLPYSAWLSEPLPPVPEVQSTGYLDYDLLIWREKRLIAQAESEARIAEIEAETREAETEAQKAKVEAEARRNRSASSSLDASA
ncbi:tRNA (adenine(58)-N(1))-methyltransferase non-catalytic subunit trm6, partial [Ascosphaera pollenicola]